MASLSIPLPLISGVVETVREVKTEHKAFTRISQSAGITILRNIVTAEQSGDQAALSMLATFWLDHALPMGEDDKKFSADCRTMLLELEALIWGNDHKKVAKPQCWKNCKSIVVQSLTAHRDVTCLFSSEDDRDSVLPRSALMKLLPAKATDDVKRAESALKTLNSEDMSSDGIRANADAVCSLIRAAVGIIGQPAVHAAGYVTASRNPVDIIRELLDDDHVETIRAMLAAHDKAQAPAIAKAA